MAHTFTIRQAEYIRANWREKTDREIGEALGLGRVQIRNFRQRDGLMGKPKNLGRWRKGQTPWNKGKRYQPGNEATQFKPGDLPQNTKYDGCISIRCDKRGVSYKYVRIGISKWEYLHRELWRRKHGPIPQGMILVFKDGDPMNVRLANLELITRAENMRRNLNRKKARATMRRRIQEDQIRLKYGLEPKMTYSQRFIRY